MISPSSAIAGAGGLPAAHRNLHPDVLFVKRDVEGRQLAPGVEMNVSGPHGRCSARPRSTGEVNTSSPKFEFVRSASTIAASQLDAALERLSVRRISTAAE